MLNIPDSPPVLRGLVNRILRAITLTPPTTSNKLITEADLGGLGLTLPFEVLVQSTQVPAGKSTSVDEDWPDPPPASTDRIVTSATGNATDDQLVITWRCRALIALADWPTNAFKLELWRDDDTNVTFSLVTGDTAGATQDTKTPTPAASTWETTTVTAADLAGGTYTQHGEFSIILTIELDAADHGRCTRPRSGA